MEVGTVDETFDTDGMDGEGIDVIPGVDFLQENNIGLNSRKEE